MRCAESKIQTSIDAINSKYVKNTNTNDPTLQFPLVVDETTDYYMYVRARHESGTDPSKFSIRFSGVTKYSDYLKDQFHWYPFTFSLNQGTATVYIRGFESESNIDRIIITKVSDIEISTNNPQNIQIPLWANVMKANIEYSTTTSTATFDHNTMNGALMWDVYDNVTVYSSGGNTYGLNITDYKVYNIETGGEIDSITPSISMGEVVFNDESSGDIYYTDLRKGTSNLENLIISAVDEMDYPGTSPKISDGTVVWVHEDQLCSRLTDSWHFIPIEEEPSYVMDFPNFDVSGRSVAWISFHNPTQRYHVKLAYLGILADVQEDKVDEKYLTPHVFDVAESSQYYSFEQMDIYENKIVYMETHDSTYLSKIMIYDHETGTNSQVYPTFGTTGSINYNQPIHIWGNYVSWIQDVSGADVIRIKDLESGTIQNVNVDPETYSLNIGKIFYRLAGQSNIKSNCANITFKLEDEYDIHHNNQTSTLEKTSFDFSIYLNAHLSTVQDQTSSETTTISISEQEDLGTGTVNTVNIYLDGTTDPFCNDIDGDGLSDGFEMLNYYNSSLMEIEDSMDFKEWIEPICADPDPTWTNLAGSMYKSSPMFYPEGIDLISGDYVYDKTEEDEYLWVNTTSFIQYDLEYVESGNTYNINTVKNDRIWEAYAEFDDFDFGNMQPTMSSRGNEFNVFGSTGSSNLRQKHYWLNDTESQYVNDVLDHIIVFNYSGVGDEPVKVNSESRDYNHIWCKLGYISDTAEDYYDESEEENLLLIALDLEYSAEVIFGGATTYKLEIRIDLDLLPDELNPLKASELGERSLVPDGFPAERFHFIKLMNLDRIVVQEKILSPMYRDTDEDELNDLDELSYGTYPLSGDPDLDGISDEDEVNTYQTSGVKRDTDGDGIRDSVELSLESVELLTDSSLGSYYERKARNGDFFVFSPITNIDANMQDSTVPTEPDTDFDGLPDGWIDGWRYFGEYEYGYAGSYYSPDKWKGGFDYDNLIQVFEGEDLNLDGSVSSSWTSWNFDGLIFEFTGDGSGECNPLARDTDSDDIPDGYEIWYSTQEPFVQENGNLILNPLVNDASLDLDPRGYYTLFEPTMLGSTDIINTDYPRVAQEINFTPSNHMSKIARIGVMAHAGDIKCIEIWTGDGNGPINKIHTSRTPELIRDYGDATEYVFKVPQGIFYNGLNCGLFYVAIPYTGDIIAYRESNYNGNIFRYQASTDQWNQINDNLMFILYNYSLIQDGLTNLEEYVVGTNPKNRSSDMDKWGTWNDLLEDGKEVANYGEGQNYVLARTDIENGALTFEDVESGTSSNEYFNFNIDPLGNNFRFDHYVFENNLNDKGDQYTYTSWDSRVAFSLRDGSIVSITQEGMNKYLIVWDDNYLDLDLYWEDQLGNKNINCSYVRFTFDVLLTIGDYTIDEDFRGQDIYFSDPCRFDTDNDGILDGVEIDWNENSDDSFTVQEETDLGTDCICNVRDIDSDNDGVNDGEEINFNQVCQGQGLDSSDTRENMIDPDSDGDGLYDGTEHDWASDTDHDGISNMEDSDSDNDGLCDGWREDFVWDPKANSNEGGFVDESVSDTFSASDFDVDDVWEGEDQDCDGIVDSTETDPLHWDTDTDGLWDGFDIKIEGEMKLGEIYIPGSSVLNGFVSEYIYTREYVESTEQSGSTDPLDRDSDGDGLMDGYEEVFNWGNKLYLFVRIPTSTGSEIVQYTTIKSDPSLPDTDGDTKNDFIELQSNSMPTLSDTDEDGIEDDEEIDSGKTLPNNYDSDLDMIPDGWVDGWWYDTTNEKGYIDVENDKGHKDSNPDCWEGEDLDCDGVLDSGETKPDSADSDDDNLTEMYEYFFNLKYEWYNPDSDPSYPCDADQDGIINSLENDSDSDGLLDGEENSDRDGEIDATLGSGDNPNFETAIETNPFDDDSDNDTILDGEDSRIDPNEPSDPVYWKWDSDKDGLINAMDDNSDSHEDSTSDNSDNTPLGSNLLPNVDSDGDGLINSVEWDNGSWDNDTDSDDDGLNDYAEIITYSTNPVNKWSDSDSYEDKFEIDNGLNPNSNDTDGDGLQDDHEKEGIQDTDNDGINNANDVDSDNDGIEDGVELKIYNSDPTDNDCDNDGLLDGEEITYKTEIFSKYTDSDEWTDYYEIKTALTDPRKPDSDFDGARDSVDFCHEPGMEIMFSVREFIPIDKGDSDGKPDPYMVSIAYSSKDNITSPQQYDDINWKMQDTVKYFHTSQGVLEEYGGHSIIGFGEYNHNPTNPSKALFPNRYNYDDDFGEKWKHDGTKTRNEMKYKFSFSTDGLENDARLIRFIVMIYDDDPNDDDLFDISPVPNKYGEKPNDEDFWDGSLFYPNDCVDGKALDIIYDTNTSLWYVMDEDDKIVEGWNYTIDSGGLTIDYDKCGNTSGDPSWGGYCSGAEDNGNTKGGSLNAAISFDIFPVNKTTYSTYNNNHYFEAGDTDHDKLTQMSEHYYYHTNITDKNTDDPHSSAHAEDYFDDWWEIRYEMDPLDNLDFESGTTSWKGERDNESDGLNYSKEYDYFEWGANPYVKDIYVEVDWMKKSGTDITYIPGYPDPTVTYWEDEYKLSEKSQNKVIRSFSNHEICLHIDDGCMGGGGSLSSGYYEDKTAFYKKSGSDNDFWDKFKVNNFEEDRQGIFHYCLFSRDAELSDGSTQMGVSEMPEYGEYAGSLLEGADDFIIGEKNWHKSIPDIMKLFGLVGTIASPPKGDKSTVQAAIFMHELGHNLGLIFTGGYHILGMKEGYEPNGHHSCMNYYYILSYVNYSDDEWNDLNLENISEASFN